MDRKTLRNLFGPDQARKPPLEEISRDSSTRVTHLWGLGDAASQAPDPRLPSQVQFPPLTSAERMQPTPRIDR